MIGTFFNEQVFQAVLRWLIDKFGVWLVAGGILTQNQEVTASGAIVTLAVLIFSVVSARFKHAAIETAGGKPAVKVAIADEKARANPTGL